MDNQSPPTPEPQSSIQEINPGTNPGQPGNPTSRNWKKWILIGLVLLLVIVGGSAFVFSQQKSQEPEVASTAKPTVSSPSPTPDPTADWETYATDNFSFQYPADYVIQERVRGFFVMNLANVTPAPLQGIFVDTRHNDTYENMVKTQENGLINPIVRDIANGIIISGNIGPGFGEGMSVRTAILKYKQSAITIAPDQTVSTDFFAQILSTFKFIDSNVNPVSDSAPEAKPSMEIYSTNYGFNFQYPDNFILNNTSTSETISFLQQQNDIKAQRLLVDITKTDQSLEDFGNSQNYGVLNDSALSPESITIDGHQALAYTKLTSMQDECKTGSSEKMKRTSLLLVKGTDFIVAFVVNDSCYTLENDWFSQIPPTIKFTK